MTKYFLWGDKPGNREWKGVADELVLALTRYRDKYGSAPTVALVSARELGDMPMPAVEGVRVEARPHVPARSMLIG